MNQFRNDLLVLLGFNGLMILVLLFMIADENPLHFLSASPTARPPAGSSLQ